MNRKDYIKIAELLYQAHEDFSREEQDGIEIIARRFADMLRDDNENFDRERFMLATRIGGKK